jgi:hypothetical protein
MSLRLSGYQSLQLFANGGAKRLHLDGDDVGPRPANYVQQAGVGGGASPGHPNVRYRGQPGRQRFSDHQMIIAEQ